jgi:hypothetical protein
MSESDDKKRHDLLSFHRLLLLCLPLTSAVVINCTFRMDSWSIGSVYQCALTSDPQITSPAVTITSATGNHTNSSMTHASVKSFYTNSQSQTINYFPSGLSDFFPNLEAIFIYNGRLIEVHQSDLRTFTTLRLLSLWQNNITFLEKDLFKYNTELEWIEIHDNKITSIYPTVFDRLEKLTGLHVFGNECVTAGSVGGNREKVLALIEDVKKQCSDFDWQNFLKINKVEHDLIEFRQRSESQSSAVEKNITIIIQRMISEHESKSLVSQKQSDENVRNLSSAVVEAIKGLHAEMNQRLTVMQENQEQLELKSKEQVSFLTFITEKEPLFFFVALPSVLLLTVLNVLVIFACLKRGEKKKEKQERVAVAAEEGVELREMQQEGA